MIHWFTVYGRIIDLGCGTAPYYPAALPPAETYLGVDNTPSHLELPPGVGLIKGDAVDTLKTLGPGPDDLIISTFAAHHIGQERLLVAIADAHCSGADFMIVDPIRLHATSWLLHWLASVGSGARALGALRSSGASRFIREMLLAQLRFLLSRAGMKHLIADFQRGQPARAAEFGSLAKSVFNISTLAVEQVGPLLLIAGGPVILQWIRTEAKDAAESRPDQFYPLP